MSFREFQLQKKPFRLRENLKKKKDKRGKAYNAIALTREHSDKKIPFEPIQMVIAHQLTRRKNLFVLNIKIAERIFPLMTCQSPSRP